MSAAVVVLSDVTALDVLNQRAAEFRPAVRRVAQQRRKDEPGTRPGVSLPLLTIEQVRLLWGAVQKPHGKLLFGGKRTPDHRPDRRDAGAVGNEHTLCRRELFGPTSLPGSGEGRALTSRALA